MNGLDFESKVKSLHPNLYAIHACHERTESAEVKKTELKENVSHMKRNQNNGNEMYGEDMG
jgi:hypothetical protein